MFLAWQGFTCILSSELYHLTLASLEWAVLQVNPVMHDKASPLCSDYLRLADHATITGHVVARACSHSYCVCAANVHFWSHEWVCHGTCSGLSVKDYFSTAIHLYNMSSDQVCVLEHFDIPLCFPLSIGCSCPIGCAGKYWNFQLPRC